MIILIGLYLFLAVVIGVYAQTLGFDFFFWFAISAVFTPFIGFLVLLIFLTAKN